MASLTLSTALSDALAEVAFLVAVAQLDGFVGAGAGAGRDGGTAAGAVVENDLDFHRRIAPAVENLTPMQFGDFHNQANKKKYLAWFKKRSCQGIHQGGSSALSLFFLTFSWLEKKGTPAVSWR